MQRSGDTSTYLSLTRGCRPCADLADAITQIYADGGSVVGAGGDVTEVVVGKRLGDAGVYEFSVDNAASSALDAEGSVVSRTAAGSSRYQIRLERNGTSWVVTSFSRFTT